MALFNLIPMLKEMAEGNCTVSELLQKYAAQIPSWAGHPPEGAQEHEGQVQDEGQEQGQQVLTQGGHVIEGAQSSAQQVQQVTQQVQQTQPGSRVQQSVTNPNGGNGLQGNKRAAPAFGAATGGLSGAFSAAPPPSTRPVAQAAQGNQAKSQQGTAQQPRTQQNQQNQHMLPHEQQVANAAQNNINHANQHSNTSGSQNVKMNPAQYVSHENESIQQQQQSIQQQSIQRQQMQQNGQQMSSREAAESNNSNISSAQEQRNQGNLTHPGNPESHHPPEVLAANVQLNGQNGANVANGQPLGAIAQQAQHVQQVQQVQQQIGNFAANGSTTTCLPQRLQTPHVGNRGLLSGRTGKYLY